MLAKVLVSGEKPTKAEGNLLELACVDCRNTLRKNGQQATRVLHRYDVLGELVESVIEK